MAQWKVYGSVQVGVEMTVDADTKEEAYDKADELWPGLTDYCGHGANGGRLIGHTEEFMDISADAGYEPEWTEAEPA